MEHHPEENHNREDKKQSHYTLFCLSRSKFGSAGSGISCLCIFLLVDENMGIRASAERIDEEADHQRDAGHSESVAVTSGKGRDIVVGKSREISGRHAVFGNHRGKLGPILGSVEIAVA